MERRFEVRWYEYNLTRKKSRKFFTGWGASLFQWWLSYFYGETAKVYES